MPALLTAADPAPFEMLNPDGASALVLVADHAGNAVPAALFDLGLPAEELNRHIGIDIGTAWIGEKLSADFDAVLVRATYSRLVVDLNRPIESPTSMPPVSDGTAVPGNHDLTPAARAARLEAIFHPYHQAIAAAVTRVAARGQTPIIVSLHSFTPRIEGTDRPWHLGFLYDRDDRLARLMIAEMRRDPGLLVGDNQPYSGRNPSGFTIEHHAENPGRAHVTVEFRQDLVDTPEKAADWAGRFAAALRTSLAHFTKG